MTEKMYTKSYSKKLSNVYKVKETDNYSDLTVH